MIAKVARATTSPIKARKRLGIDAPRNLTIRYMAITHGKIKVQMMRETTSVLTGSPPSGA